MKNLLLVTVMLTAAFSADAIEINPIVNTIESTEKSNDTLAKITAARIALEERGYDSEMISVLFGDDNFYFPTSKEELSLTIYIIDFIIDNGQFEKSDKSKLVLMAKEAYRLFNSSSEISVSQW